MDIRDIVESLIHKYHTRDPYDLADFLYIRISRHELGNIRGYYLKKYRIKQILLNCRLSKFEEKFVLAHEIGHSVMHPNINAPFLKEHSLITVSKFEMAANKFAVELLIPNELLLENWQLTIEQLSQLTGYSEALIKLRLQ